MEKQNRNISEHTDSQIESGKEPEKYLRLLLERAVQESVLKDDQEEYSLVDFKELPKHEKISRTCFVTVLPEECERFADFWKECSPEERKLLHPLCCVKTQKDLDAVSASFLKLEKADLEMPKGILFLSACEKEYRLNGFEPNCGIKMLCVSGEQDGNILDFSLVRILEKESRRLQAQFFFISTGPHLLVNGRVYEIPFDKQLEQAEKAGKLLYHAFLQAKLDALSRSKFRASFSLNAKEKEYLQNRTPQQIKEHAAALLEKRLFVSEPVKDGRQTPYHGHPVFPVQHACGCCCRKCLEKWHHIPRHKKLCAKEKEYVLDLLLARLYEKNK
jgi:hypothetical protein